MQVQNYFYFVMSSNKVYTISRANHLDTSILCHLSTESIHGTGFPLP